MNRLFFEIQRNGLSRAKGVVIFDTGHHLTSHPTDAVSAKSQPCKGGKKNREINTHIEHCRYSFINFEEMKNFVMLLHVEVYIIKPNRTRLAMLSKHPK